MKKYYLCQLSEDVAEVGDFPQCWSFEKGIPKEEKEKFYDVDSAFRFNTGVPLRSITYLAGLKIGGRSKRTDVLDCIVPITPVVNKKVLDILEKFNLGDYYALPMTLSKRGVTFEYFCFFCLNNMTDYIDYENSIFKIIGRIAAEFTNSKIQNFEMINELKSNSRKTVEAKEIFLKNDFPKGYDVFRLSKVMRYTDLFISEELCKAIEEAKITGWQIDYTRSAIVE